MLSREILIGESYNDSGSLMEEYETLIGLEKEEVTEKVNEKLTERHGNGFDNLFNSNSFVGDKLNLFFVKYLDQIGILKNERDEYVLNEEIKEQADTTNPGISLSLMVILSQLYEEKDFNSLISSFTDKLRAIKMSH